MPAGLQVMYRQGQGLQRDVKGGHVKHLMI